MSGKDYYKILGISKNASDDDIKKAFRELAKKYHPDLHKGSKHHEDKFKEINEAYAVLSDAEKRKQYDMYGSEGFGKRYSQEDIFQSADTGSIADILSGLGFSDGFFSKIFGGGGRRGGGRVKFTSAQGSPFQGFPFEGMQGGMGSGGFEGMPFQGGLDSSLVQEAELPLTLEEAFLGGRRTVALQGQDGRITEVAFTVPAGVENGQQIRLAPKGGTGSPVMLRVRLKGHGVFRREGKDLFVEREVPLTTMVLGGEVDVPTLGGPERKLKVKAGTTPSARIRIQGQGYGRKESRGDLYVTLAPKIPASLTTEQAKLFAQLRETGL